VETADTKLGWKYAKEVRSILRAAGVIFSTSLGTSIITWFFSYLVILLVIAFDLAFSASIVLFLALLGQR
jgi:hypothetical protein